MDSTSRAVVENISRVYVMHKVLKYQGPNSNEQQKRVSSDVVGVAAGKVIGLSRKNVNKHLTINYRPYWQPRHTTANPILGFSDWVWNLIIVWSLVLGFWDLLT